MIEQRTTATMRKVANFEPYLIIMRIVIAQLHCSYCIMFSAESGRDIGVGTSIGEHQLFILYKG